MNDKSKNPIDDEIDLLELALYLLRHWYVLAVCFLIGAVSLGYTAYIKPYTYTSYASILIQPENTNLTTMSDVQLSNALSADFLKLATCKAVADKAVENIEEETGEVLTRGEVLGSTSITNIEDTRILVFRTTTTDPARSRCIAQNMAKAAAEQVSSIMKIDEPTIVDHAEMGTANGKGTKKKALMGGAAGFMVPAIIYVLLFLFNDKVTTEADVERYLDANIIGTISLDRSVAFQTKKRKKTEKKK